MKYFFKKYWTIIYQFLMTRFFWIDNLHARFPLPDVWSFDAALDRMPKYSASDKFDCNWLENTTLDPLKVPRHFGFNAKKQISICNTMKNFSYRFFNGLCNLDQIKNPKDGGAWYDWFIGRSEGDTPITICEYFTLMNIKALEINKSHDNCQKYHDWFKPFVEYVRGYKPAQLNNHVTWKALFLATSGLVLRRSDYMQEAYFLYQLALSQLDEDGFMPLEQIRDEKSCSYFKMNLEGLIHLQNIFGEREVKIDKALFNFQCLMDRPDLWIKNLGLPKDQDRPENMWAWGWMFLFERRIDIAEAQDAYLSHFTSAWRVDKV